MAFLDFVGSRGAATQAVNGTTVACTVTDDLPVGAFVVVRIGAEYLGASSAETTRLLGVADDVAGTDNVWTKVLERSSALAGFSPGATVALFVCRLTTAIPAASLITATFDATATARNIAATEYDALDPENDVELIGYATAGADGTPATTGEVTYTPPAAEDALWLGVGAFPESPGGTWAADATFTDDPARFTANGSNNANNVTLWGQYRLTGNDEDTWEFDHGPTSRMFALGLAAFRLVEPPPPPAEPGTRDFQAEFETETFDSLDATTARRVDAIRNDPRRAETMGPIAIDDPTQGLELRPWYVRADDAGNLWAARGNAGNTAWGAETLLTTYPVSGAPILELGVAFNEAGQIFVVAERATGPAGASQVWLYWYNPHPMIGYYLWETIGLGTSPRVISDYFPPGALGPNTCPPEIDVQLFYMKTGTGLVRLEESDGFTAENLTPLSWSASRRIEGLFKTTDHRVSVSYSERNATTGRYLLKRLDSLPFADALLRRPSFVNWTDPGNDLWRRLDDAAHNPSDMTVDETWQISIETPQDVDGIEFACCVDFPVGILPAFDEQPWDSDADGGYTAGLTAGQVVSHGVDVSHGQGGRSIQGFRARTYRVVDSVLCVSPWRYAIYPLDWPLVSVTADELVNCDRDQMLDVPTRDNFARYGRVEVSVETTVSARNDGRPFVCTDGPDLDATDTLPGAGPYAGFQFAGGVRNFGPDYPFPTHNRNWQIRRRAVEPLLFSDENGTILGTVVGAEIDGASSGNGGPAIGTSSSRYPAQFPDDAGIFQEDG